MARPRKNPIPPADEGTAIETEVVVNEPDSGFTYTVGETRIIGETMTVGETIVVGETVQVPPQPIAPMTAEEMEALRVERKDISEVTTRTKVRSTEAKPTLRGADMLSDEQRVMLLKDGIRRILNKNPIEGRIPSMIRYTGGPDGIVSVYAFFDIDARVMEEAYDYYRNNADDPSPKGMIDLVSEVFDRPKRVIPRCALLNWTGKPMRR